MTPDQREAVTKGLLDVASALQRVAAALTDQPGQLPDHLKRCGYWSPVGGQCVLPLDDPHTEGHVPESV